MIKSNTSKPPKSDIKRDSFKWGNVRIGLKYSTVFIVAALLFIVAGGIVYLQLHEGQQEVKAIEEHSTRVNDMAHLESLIQIKDVQVSDYVLTKNEKYIDSYTVYQKEFDNLAEKLTPTMNTEEQIKILDEIKKSSTNMNDNFVKDMVGAVKNDQVIIAKSLRDVSSRIRTETTEKIDELIGLIQSEQTASVQAARNSMDKSIITLAIAGLTAILIGAALMIVISRRITYNLKEVVGITAEVVKGNLKVKSIAYEGKDEVGQLAAAVNQMKDNIQNILIKIASASKSVSSKSEQVGASVGEITTIVNNIQNETDHVVDSLNAGYGEVQEGAIQIKATGDNFKRINNSVSDMADKIGIISTNLEGISRNSNNMNNLIEEIASVSEESAAGVEQTAASVQQTASSMEEVSYSSRELAGLAEQLNEELKVFTL